MAPDALAQVLRPLAGMFSVDQFPQLLVGLGGTDDAAVYKVTDDVALIATLDFFTPIVDDPYQYGAVAATNALSDIYAMGGEVAIALNICCLSECLPVDIISEILRGGADKVHEAGGVLAGGHSVDDKEPKYGLAAIGFVHPDRVLTKNGARHGDVLVLTKPLGVGIISTAFKADHARPEHMTAAVESMLRLNRTASQLLQAHGARACTDVTGFALLGHCSELAEKSDVCLRIHATTIPFLPGAEEYADSWLFPGGTARNKHAYQSRVRVADGVIEEVEQLLYTPETSGGLIATIPADRLDDLKSAFDAARHPLWVIGEVSAASDHHIEIIP